MEAALLVRLAKKASFYGQELDASGNPIPSSGKELKIDVDEVVKLYKDYIIPLTKVVEVRSDLNAPISRTDVQCAGGVSVDKIRRTVRGRRRKAKAEQSMNAVCVHQS